ncbi:PA2778 family cysteine peptidase [Thiohalomonas denitrificans]|uniref:TPR repeat-containing protein n=1 Tax=Thiohalomonas denitrificans TaxID=415747 RepID=A0A1G5Q8I4_9GAMM|nr:PA2778 family cysteine peptidase [Thiohalomonas denitrificans]SCZ57780.1 TPR repeat-containing protein [Thiohalomonas denitrificans]
MIRSLLLTTLVAGLIGCAGAPTLPASDAPQARVSAPFFPQTLHHCGPAALASVLGWSGAAATPEQLAEWVYLPGREGALQAELLAEGRRQGRLTYLLEPSLESLVAELQAGHPVLVLQNLAFGWAPRWHYAVAVGYDLDAGIMELHSGTRQRYRSSLDTFYRTWKRAGRWAVVVLPPDRLPATAEPQRYLRAVIDLEAVGQTAAAKTGYRTALQRWSDSTPARVGLASLLYRQGDRTDAEQLLREALATEPTSVPVLNNLAHLLNERGEKAEAERLARRALREPGPWRDDVRATLEEILR